jgi:uroporphyrinogen decarboxylase
MSPGMYRELILPGERRIVEAAHERGGLVRLHICGDITRHLPVVAELGADIVDLDWQVDMSEARKLLGARAVLTGNLDPANAVKGGAPEEIRRRVREIYSAVGDPYMAGAGCEIPSGTPDECLKALCEPVPVG